MQGLMVTDISDHYPIFHVNRQVKAKDTEIYMEKRVYSDKNKRDFTQALAGVDFSQIYSVHGTQSSFDLFHGKLLTLLNKYFPKVRMKKKYNNRKPWLSEGLRQSIKHKNKLYYNYRKIKSVHNEVVYKAYKYRLQKLLQAAEKQYYHGLIVQYKNDMKKSWGIIKNIINKNKTPIFQSTFKLNNGSIISDKKAVSEHFNDFFINVGPTLARKIPNVGKLPKDFLGQMVEESLFLEPVTSGEINKLIAGLKNTATGYDDISSTVLKLSLEYIADPLVHICNSSLIEGVFPEQLKIACVLPLYKAEDPMYFNHYRPVSLLNLLSKVFEKLMYDRLLNFLNKLSIIYEHQFGFRKKHSTHMALLSLIDRLTHAIEDGEYVIGVFLDFSKAFDTVDHGILLDKLFHYGIRGCAYNWFASYLSNRKQFVSYNGVQSEKQTIECGVPQGSILGPLLFLVYINDLPDICQHTFPVLFADDTNLFFSGKNIDYLEQTINTELDRITLWLKANKLSLNIKKTQFMMFSGFKKNKPSIKLNIEGEPISETIKSKFLGVIIDNKLSWKDHIAYISGKIARGIGIILKARKYLLKESLISLYYSFIYPYMIYCNHVWGLACKTHLDYLIKLQKRVIRIIAGVHPRTHTEPLFRKLNLLKCEDINKYLIGRLMFRIHNNEMPIFHNFFTRNRDVHSHDTRQKDHFHIPPFKTKLRKASLRHNGASVWNMILKIGINTKSSEFQFAKSLKSEILSGNI